MKIKQVREDIKEISKPICDQLGFKAIGEVGELQKIDENGNTFAIFIEERKQSTSISISVRACVKYKSIDDLFPEIESAYILNSILDFRSISFEDYSKEELRKILDHLVLQEAVPFFNLYDTEFKVFENLALEDHKKWVVSDKTSQFKAKFASALIAKDNEILSAYLMEANAFLQKPWSAMYEEQIKQLCAHVQASM